MWWSRSGRPAASAATSCRLAAARGARVIAISSAENADTARKLGAADVVDYAAGDVVEAVRSLAPVGVDVIAEMYGGDDTARLAELVRSGGRVVSAVGGADEETLKARGIEARTSAGRWRRPLWSRSSACSSGERS